jgi:hypothetical protein
MTFPEPGALQAGLGMRDIPAPVGIGTAGYGPFSAPVSPSPFAVLYPGTTRIHGHPSFKAVVLSRGAGNEIVFVRSDTVGVFQQLRRAIALEVEHRLGRSIDDALIIGGTHSHSGPGRIVSAGDALDIVADKFSPEYYSNFVDAAASAIMDAYGDLEPAQVGSVTAMSKDGHKDRRCEDGRDYTNDRLPVIAVQRGGKIDAVIFAYAAHGTVLTIDDLTLSEDASGSMEAHVEAGFDHPVMAMFFNSWGADMAPGDPMTPAPTAAPQPAGYDRLLQVGKAVAGSIHTALAGITYDETPVLYAEVHRVPLNREALKYEPGKFPFENGGFYCNGDPSQVTCTGTAMITDLDQTCLGIPEKEVALQQTEISAGQIGKLKLVTFPGEPGTLLAEKLLGELGTDFSATDVMMFGYTQDYIGYSILEDDWWHGGYEASGAIWGPRQGQYLLDRAHEVFQHVVVDGRGGGKLDDEVEPLAPFTLPSFTPYAAEAAMDPGTIVTDVHGTYAPTEVVTLTVRGSDPWLGPPVATLQDAAGKDVLLGNGKKVHSNSYAFWVDLVTTPSYKDMLKAPMRAFEWSFSMPASVVVEDGVLPKLVGGDYRLHVVVPTTAGDKTVDSAVFTVR